MSWLHIQVLHLLNWSVYTFDYRTLVRISENKGIDNHLECYSNHANRFHILSIHWHPNQNKKWILNTHSLIKWTNWNLPHTLTMSHWNYILLDKYTQNHWANNGIVPLSGKHLNCIDLWQNDICYFHHRPSDNQLYHYKLYSMVNMWCYHYIEIASLTNRNCKLKLIDARNGLKSLQ